MIHRTFRSLDQAPKLLAFTMRQWAGLIAGSSAVLGLVYLAHLPTKPAISLCVFLIGLPAALAYVSESSGLQIGLLLQDIWRWRFSRHTLASAVEGCPHARSVVLAGEESDRLGAPALAHGDDRALDLLLSEERWER